MADPELTPVAICDEWLARFGAVEIKYTSAREYAVDAVNDIRDQLAALSRLEPRPQEGEPVAALDRQPDGWRLVPVEPTDEMHEAFFSRNAEPAEEHREERYWAGDFGQFAGSWQLALQAAPSPPQGEKP